MADQQHDSALDSTSSEDDTQVLPTTPTKRKIEEGITDSAPDSNSDGGIHEPPTTPEKQIIREGSTVPPNTPDFDPANIGLDGPPIVDGLHLPLCACDGCRIPQEIRLNSNAETKGTLTTPDEDTSESRGPPTTPDIRIQSSDGEEPVFPRRTRKKMSSAFLSGAMILSRLTLIDPLARIEQWLANWSPTPPEEPKLEIPEAVLKKLVRFTLPPTTKQEHRLAPTSSGGMKDYPKTNQISARPLQSHAPIPEIMQPDDNLPGTSQESMSNLVTLPGSNTEEDSNDESPKKIKIDNKSTAGERTPHGSWVVMGPSTSKKSKSNAKEIPLKVASPIKIRIIPLPGFSWADSTELSLLMCFKEDVGTNDRDADVFRKHPNLTPRMRAILLDWLMEVCEVYKMRRTTYYLAVDYIDRYLSRIDIIPKNQLQLLGITCLFIASKVEEIYPPKLIELAYVTDGACTDQEMLLKEMAILKELRWDVLPQTVSSWLYLFLQMACSRNKVRDTIKREYVDDDFIYPQMSTYAFMRASQLIDLCTLDDGMLQFQYSVIAAAAIYYLSNRETALYVSGLTWVKIKDCVRWMGPFAEIIRRKCLNTPFPTPKEFTRVGSGLRRENPRIILDESHTLQTHAVDLAMLEEVYALTNDVNYQNIPCPGIDEAANIDPPILKQDDETGPQTRLMKRMKLGVTTITNIERNILDVVKVKNVTTPKKIAKKHNITKATKKKIITAFKSKPKKLNTTRIKTRPVLKKRKRYTHHQSTADTSCALDDSHQAKSDNIEDILSRSDNTDTTIQECHSFEEFLQNDFCDDLQTNKQSAVKSEPNNPKTSLNVGVLDDAHKDHAVIKELEPLKPELICSIPRTGLALFLPELGEDEDRKIGTYIAGVLVDHTDDKDTEKESEMDPKKNTAKDPEMDQTKDPENDLKKNTENDTEKDTEVDPKIDTEKDPN